MPFNLDTLKGLSIERLQTLCLVAERGGITKAAKGNPNRQSLYSRQIKELETALGVSLINRGQTPRCLTALGEKLEHAAREFLRQIHDLSSRASEHRMEITIGAGESVIQGLLLPRLKDLALSDRTLCLTFRNLTSRGIVDQLLAERLDLAVVRKSALRGPLSSRSLGRLGIKPAASKRLAGTLAKKPSLDWKDLARHPWVILEGDGELRASLLGMAAEAGVIPDIALQCTSYGQIIDVVSSSPVIGFLPEFLFSAQRPQIQALDFAGTSTLGREMVIAWHPAAVRRRPVITQIIEAIAAARQPQSKR
jgi:DNA-binding transcriptional LysR family regulator